MATIRTWIANRAALLLFFVMCMNVLDGYLTAGWLELGVIEEANPLMAFLLEVGPWVFMWVKVTLVTLGCFLLWRYRHRGSSQMSLLLVLGVYGWVMVKHYEVWKLVEVYGVPPFSGP
jgi:hypothetical protein